MNDQRDKYPRLRDELTVFEGVEAFTIRGDEKSVFVRYDGPAKQAHVFTALNRLRLIPTGCGLMLYKQEGLKT